ARRIDERLIVLSQVESVVKDERRRLDQRRVEVALLDQRVFPPRVRAPPIRIAGGRDHPDHHRRDEETADPARRGLHRLVPAGKIVAPAPPPVPCSTCASASVSRTRKKTQSCRLGTLLLRTRAGSGVPAMSCRARPSAACAFSARPSRAFAIARTENRIPLGKMMFVASLIRSSHSS